MDGVSPSSTSWALLATGIPHDTAQRSIAQNRSLVPISQYSDTMLMDKDRVRERKREGGQTKKHEFFPMKSGTLKQ